VRTTLNLDDHLVIAAKKKAARDGTTLSRLIEDALRQSLARSAAPAPAPVDVPVFRGRPGLRPGVVLTDNAALRDVLDGD
jgi:hypothetical protein